MERRIQFWLDTWVGQRSLKDMFSHLFQLALLKYRSVRDHISEFGGFIGWCLLPIQGILSRREYIRVEILYGILDTMVFRGESDESIWADVTSLFSARTAALSTIYILKLILILPSSLLSPFMSLHNAVMTFVHLLYNLERQKLLTFGVVTMARQLEGHVALITGNRCCSHTILKLIFSSTNGILQKRQALKIMVMLVKVEKASNNPDLSDMLIILRFCYNVCRLNDAFSVLLQVPSAAVSTSPSALIEGGSLSILSGKGTYPINGSLAG